MPRRIPLTDDNIQWLRDNFRKVPYTKMAKHIGCCEDTLKRILARHDIQHFDAAKFEVSAASQQQMWERPCTRCKCTQRRPKFQFFCDRCQRTLGLSDTAAA